MLLRLTHRVKLCKTLIQNPDHYPKTLIPRPLSSISGDSGGGSADEWTEPVDYLDESGAVLSSGPGARAAAAGGDATILAGGVRLPLPRPAAAARLAAAALHSSLPSLSFPSSAPPSPSLLLAAASSLPTSGDHPTPLLSLFHWARLQPWWVPTDEFFSLLASRVPAVSHSSQLLSIFDDVISACSSHGPKAQKNASFSEENGENFQKGSIALDDIISFSDGEDSEKTEKGASFAAFSNSLNLIIQNFAAAGLLEPSYSCFNRLRRGGGGGVLTAATYNALLSLLLSKGLAFKAFEVYEAMAAFGCALDAATYELMVPALAKSGRLDAARNLFDEMKSRIGGGGGGGAAPSPAVYTAMVDSMAKAGRLDTAMGLYREMQGAGHRATGAMNAAMVEALVRAGKLDAGMRLWDEMRGNGFRPSFGLYTMVIEANAKSGRLDVAARLFGDMEKAGFFPTPATYACLVEMHASAGQVDAAMRLYHSMANAGVRPGLSTFTALLTLLAKKKLLDLAAKVLLEMKAAGFPVEVSASDLLMIYIKEGSTELALRWLRFMGSAGIRTNNFIIRQLFESCMKTGLYDSARPLLETYVNSAAKVDLVLYTSILAHLVRCQDESDERAVMDILSATEHDAHEFMCGLFTGPEQRKKPVLSFVREFFEGIDYDDEESAARYFVNVLLNYLVLVGQMNRARCVWKVAYENKLFPKAIVFDQHIAWSLDVRNLSVGAALVSVVHTLHRFRKRMLYYGVVPRRIKLVTGPTLKMVVAQVLASLESPFEVSKVVLRAPGDSVLEWFKKPIVQQFLLNEIPSKADVLMHRLNVLFPSSAPEVRSLSPPRPLGIMSSR